MSNVALFPGAPLTPKVFQAMEDGDCDSIITVKMKDGIVDVTMSRMSIADMAFMALKLQLHVEATVQGRPPEGTDIITPESA